MWVHHTGEGKSSDTDFSLLFVLQQQVQKVFRLCQQQWGSRSSAGHRKWHFRCSWQMHLHFLLTGSWLHLWILYKDWGLDGERCTMIPYLLYSLRTMCDLERSLSTWHFKLMVRSLYSLGWICSRKRSRSVTFYIDFQWAKRKRHKPASTPLGVLQERIFQLQRHTARQLLLQDSNLPVT